MRRHVDGPVRQALSEDRGAGSARPPGATPALLERGAAQHRRAHQQRLMQDQDECGRHDVAGIGGCRVEQRHHDQLDRLIRIATAACTAGALGPRAARQRVGRISLHRFQDALQRAVEQNEIGRIRHRSAVAPATPFSTLLLGIGRDSQRCRKRGGRRSRPPPPDSWWPAGRRRMLPCASNAWISPRASSLLSWSTTAIGTLRTIWPR